MPWMQGYPYYLIMGSVLSLYLGVSSYKYRNSPGRRYLWILMLIVGFIFAATAGEIMSSSFSSKLWWKNVQQIPLFFSNLYTYAVIKDYISRPARGLSRRLSFFAVPMVADAVLIFTDSYHHWMRSEVGINTVAGISGISVKPTVLSMIFISYAQLFCIVATVLLAAYLFRAPKKELRRNLLMLAGLLVPVVAVFLLPVLKITITGFTAFAIMPATLAAYLTLYRDPPASLNPVAQITIFENMKDGIILTNRNDRIIEINEAGELMLSELSGQSPETWLGRSIDSLLETHWDILTRYMHRTEGDFEIEFPRRAGTCYGVSLVSTDRDNIDDSGMLIILSDHSDKKRYERELVYQATVDDLTGLFNRRHFIQMVTSREIPEGAGIALLLFDIDDFKLINDTYGHIAGDHALITFSEEVQRTYKNRGICGRVGGEEFAVCFFASDKHMALEEAEAFRAKMCNHVVTLDKGQMIRLTVSIGLAYSEQSSVVFEDLYRHADEALYRSKTTGKNKVTFGEQSALRESVKSVTTG